MAATCNPLPLTWGGQSIALELSRGPQSKSHVGGKERKKQGGREGEREKGMIYLPQALGPPITGMHCQKRTLNLCSNQLVALHNTGIHKK